MTARALCLSLLLLFFFGCGGGLGTGGSQVKQNIIVLLDLSDRIIQTEDQVERDIYLVNTIYQTFGQKIKREFDDSGDVESIYGNQFRIAVAGDQDSGNYDDLLKKLRLNTSGLDEQGLEQLLSEEGLIEFSTNLYKLYDRAVYGNRRNDRDAYFEPYFEERLSDHFIKDPNTVNYLFLVTDGGRTARDAQAGLQPVSNQFPGLNVFLLEANLGADQGNHETLQTNWKPWLENMGAYDFLLERRESSILAVRDKISRLLSGEMPASFTAYTSPMEEESPFKAPAGRKNSPQQEEIGVVLEEAHFWLGHPDRPGSMVLLKLDPETRVEILDEDKGYFKVSHHNLIGFLKKGHLKISSSGKDAGTEHFSEAVALSNDSPTSGSKGKNSSNSASLEISPCTGELGADLLPGVSCTQYKAKVLKKVGDLETYIKRILDKSEPNRLKSVDMACRLFVNEQAKVYTSGLESNRRSRPIRKYLNGLMSLNYDKVEIEWTNIQYVSDLRKGPDGKYFGYVHIEQRFEGYMDGRLVYGDLTEKNIMIVLEAYEYIDPQGNSNIRWDIFLSDIGVDETKNYG